MKFSNFFNNKISNYLKKADHIEDLLKIQELSIPAILRKENCIVVSSTGSGKTLCFVLPILVNLTKQAVPQVVILLPTNELAKQIYKVIKHYQELFSEVTIYNAFNKHKSQVNITNKIILASPTELIKLIRNGQLSLKNLQTVVMDEADMLFEFFKTEITNLLNYFKTINNLQYCLFSATLHESLANSIKRNIANCQVISDKKDIWNNENIAHFLIKMDLPVIDEQTKLNYLNNLLQKINPFFALVFVNNKQDAQTVYNFLLKQNYKVGVLYGEMNHKIRHDVLLKANKLFFNVLVCTDLAARGIDLNGVSDVISYDLPKDDLYYIHRAGRTGRGKYTGNSYIFAFGDASDKISKLMQKIKFERIKLKI